MIKIFMYEMKKLLNRRIVWASMAISLLLCLITVCAPLLGSYYIDGARISSNYEEFQIDKAYQEALDGRLIDEQLIREMQEAYSRVPLEQEKYSQTEEYQKYARPYSAIFNYVRSVAGLSGKDAINRVTSTENLHSKRLESQEKRWESFHLTEIEKAYWRTQEERLENPVIFRYTGGYYVLISGVNTIGLLAIFVVSICLAGVFPEEHVRRTDQLLLSSKHGREEVYRAKFSAGILLALCMTLAMILFTLAATFFFYGTEGFHAAFQLEYPGSSCPISIGEAALIAYIVVLFAGLFMGALVMMLSEIFHSSVATLAVAMGIMVLPMFFSVPDEYRVLSQLWSYLPSDFVAIWNIFSPKMVIFGKTVFQAWQAVPALYTLSGILFAFMTKCSFVNYQVSGR